MARVDVAPLTARSVRRLGTRAEQRAVPRFGPAIGAAGALVAFLGIIILSFDTSTPSDFEEDGDHLVAALLCVLAVAVGYALIAVLRTGSLATAGSTVAALALPFVFVFLTFDLEDLPPFSVDITLGVATVLWALAFLVGPGRGRPIFGGAALGGLWLFVAEQVESVFTAPFAFGVPSVEGLEGPTETPDPTMIGVISLAFGCAYVASALVLDRKGLQGLATPFFVIGEVALIVGYLSIAEDLEVLGTGIFVTLTGAVIALIGTQCERRATTWLGAAGVVLGVVLIIGDLFEDSDSTTVPSIVLVVVGVLVAILGELWSRVTDEPPEVAEADEPLGPPPAPAFAAPAWGPPVATPPGPPVEPPPPPPPPPA